MNTIEICGYTGYDPHAIDRSLKCEHEFQSGWLGTKLGIDSIKMVITPDKICNKCVLPKSMIDEIFELSKK